MAENKIDEATSLKQILQGVQVESMEIIRGTVTSASPLKIQIDNDEKRVANSNNTYVPRHLTDYNVVVSISKGTNGSVNAPTNTASSHSHSLTDFNLTGSMTVYNSLKAGDKVHILSFNHGKQYYVLDRAN